jgi:hypothetical protein
MVYGKKEVVHMDGKRFGEEEENLAFLLFFCKKV